MLNLRATARNINLIILITKDREGWSVFRRCLINIDIGRLFFAHVQSAKVVPPTPSFVIRRSRFLSRFNAIFISRYIYICILLRTKSVLFLFSCKLYTPIDGQIERYVLSNSIINDSIFASFKFSRVTINLKYYNQLSIRNYRDVTNVLNRVWICASGSEWNNLIHRFFLESKNDIGNNIEAIASRSNVCARR